MSMLQTDKHSMSSAETHIGTASRMGAADTENACTLVCGPLPGMHRYTGAGVYRVFSAATTRCPSRGDLGKCLECQEVQTLHFLSGTISRIYCAAKSTSYRRGQGIHPFFVGH